LEIKTTPTTFFIDGRLFICDVRNGGEDIDEFMDLYVLFVPFF
jgi:hypothetical protein